LAAFLLIACVPPASAAPLLVVDTAVAHLVHALGSRDDGPKPWTTRSRRELFSAGCDSAQQAGLVVVSVDSPSRRELTECGGAQIRIVAPIGREAVYLLAKEADWGDPSSRDLYRALAAEVPVGDMLAHNSVRRWSELEPRLPNADIRVLLPGSDSPLRRLFARVVLEAGCRDVPAIAAIFARVERIAKCTTVRSDQAVELSAPDGDPAAWVASAPAHAIAIAAQPAIAAMPDNFSVLSVDGTFPTYSSVASGEYAASWTVYLTVIGEPALDTAVRIVAESSIGPEGSMAAAGLTPLVAAERVALRARLFAAGGS
jgi:phosphate transport system substrate-binding protein